MSYLQVHRRYRTFLALKKKVAAMLSSNSNSRLAKSLPKVSADSYFCQIQSVCSSICIITQELTTDCHSLAAVSKEAVLRKLHGG